MSDEQDLLHRAFQAYQRGVSKQRTSDLIEALECVDKTLLMNPEFEQGYSLRAQIRFQVGDHTGMLHDADRAIALTPNLGANYYNRACFHNHLKQFSMALADFRKSRELAIQSADNDLIDACDHHIPDLEILTK